MSPRRGVAAVLIASMLLVPAIARAGQSIDTGRTPAPVSSFSKSGNVPPDPVVLLPDLSANPLDILTLLQPVGRCIAARDEALPATPAVSHAKALRAPPVRISA